MSAFGIVTLRVEDRSWVADYLANVAEVVERFGGRYLAKGGDFEMVEGDDARPHTVVLLEFEDMDQLKAWYESDDYRPYREARRAGSTSTFYLVPGP